MATPNGIRSGVGFRYASIFLLDTATGLPNPGAASATAYEGVHISGVKRLTINDPEPQQIVHLGDDRPFALDSLPAQEPVSGELATAKVNDVVDALITGTNAFTVGEAKFFGIGTDKKGSENQVAMLAFRQALDTTPGAAQVRRWEIRLIPICLVLPREGNLDENPEERLYSLRPQFTSKHLWGVAFSNSVEGFLEAQVLRGITQYKPNIAVWKGNNTLTQFNLPTERPAADVDKVSVWVYDASAGAAAADATATITTTTVDPTVTPDVDDIVIALYEYA
jgi:hypothetical protein